MVLSIVQDVWIKVVQRILPGSVHPKQRIGRVLLDGSENEFSVLCGFNDAGVQHQVLLRRG